MAGADNEYANRFEIGGESTMTKLFIKIQGTRALIAGSTVAAALMCAGFFDGPH